MKHILNLIILLALIFFAIGIAYLSLITDNGHWTVLYVPLIALMIFFGFKIREDYD